MTRRTVQQHMTLSPQVVSSGQTLAQAHQIMREQNIRHLPVVDDGRLVGVVSQRDLYLLETLQGVDPGAETVEEAMSPEPFAVSPDAPLDEVALTMAKHKYGSAVVVDQGVVVGLFTTVDALRALAALLRRGRRAGKPLARAIDGPHVPRRERKARGRGRLAQPLRETVRPSPQRPGATLRDSTGYDRAWNVNKANCSGGGIDGRPRRAKRQ